MAEKKVGRPPKGRDEQGRAVPLSRTYPQLTVRVRPDVKAELDLLAFVEKRTQADVIERALKAYGETLPTSLRKSLDSLRAIRAGSAKR